MEILPPQSSRPPTSPRRFASTTNSFSNQQTIPEVKYVSILNFNKNSANVVFTEPETIEALKRLGYDQSEFNYRPLVSFYSNSINKGINQKINKFDLNATNSNLNAISSSNEYRKDTLENAMKHSAAKEMYQKFLKRRQEMIDRTIAMRSYLIKSEEQDDKPKPKITGNVRKAKIDLDNDIENYEKAKKDGRDRLKKLALVKMRDLSRDQDNMNKSMRTQERFHEIDEGNLEQTHFVDDLRSSKGFRSKDSTLPPIDRTSYRGTQLLNSPTNRSTLNRSYGGYTTMHSQWFTSKLNTLDEMKLNIELHENHLKSVLEKKQSIEDEKKMTNLTNISTKEEKNSKYMNELRAKQEEKKKAKRQLMEQRAESVRQNRETIDKQVMDSTYNNYIQNRERADRVLTERKNEKFYNTLQRKIQLEEKLQNVRHSYNAMNYNAQIEREQKAQVDESLTSIYRNKSNQVNHMRQRERWDFEYSRQKLNQEVHEMNLDAFDAYNDFNGNQTMKSSSSMNSQSVHDLSDTQRSNTFSLSNTMNMSANLTLNDTIKNKDKKKMRETIKVSKNQMDKILDEAIQSKDELSKTPRIVTKS